MAYNTTRGSYSHKGKRGKAGKGERVFGNAVQKLMLMSRRIFGVQPVSVSISICLRSCSILSALVHLEVWNCSYLSKTATSCGHCQRRRYRYKCELPRTGTESETESADRRHNKNAEGNKDDDKVSLTLRFMPQQRQRQRQHVSVKIQIHSLENADRGRPTVHCVHTRPTINYDDATLRTFEQVPKTLLGRPRCTLLQDTVYLSGWLR